MLQIDKDAYVEALTKSKAWSAFNDNPNRGVGAALELTSAIYQAADKALPPGAAFVINSSTGKDSTVMLLGYTWALAEWRTRGDVIRPCVVAIADTASEFPEMQMRMFAEVEAINRYGAQLGIPLTAEIVRPPVKHRLLVEILGNGKPMPKLTKGKSSAGAASSWCMARVKAGSLRQIAKRAGERHAAFVQTIGVRIGESAARDARIADYAKDLPFGMTMIGFDPGKADMLALMPIVHWETKWVSDALRAFAPGWRPEGREEIRRIYYKGAADLESNTECAVSLSSEGTISNSCSDLGGTRFGCWHCLLSVNKSLKNTARNDNRYAWLKKFHTYLYRQHGRNFRRVERRKKSGFTEKTLFPKTFTFEERYFMLMLLLRAETESGFTLLDSDEISMIETLWRKHGVHTVTVADAREDVKRWRETGKPVPFFQLCGALISQLSSVLGEGIPSGAWFNTELEFQAKDGLKQGLDLVHLLFMTGSNIGTPLVPQLMSWVIKDRRDSDKFVVMVTDTPSLPGTKTNTGLINGMQMAAWQCVGVREPTEWERQMSDGRSFFYQTSVREENATLDKWIEKDINKALPVLSRHYENLRLMSTYEPECVLSEEFFLTKEIGELNPSPEVFKQIRAITYALVGVSEHLNDVFGAAANQLLQHAASNLDLLESTEKEGGKFRTAFRNKTRELLDLPKHQAAFLEYIDLVKQLLPYMRRDEANPSLIIKLVMAAHWSTVDPFEEMKLLDQIQCLFNEKERLPHRYHRDPSRGSASASATVGSSADTVGKAEQPHGATAAPVGGSPTGYTPA